MKSYVWLTFGFMGWAYYEMSGGADFVPAEREVAVVAQEVQAPEIVARADSTTLLSVSTSNVVPEAEILAAVEAATALDTSESAPTEAEEEVVAVAAPVVAPEPDIREVAGSRVNMRMGPGTGYDVITTLDSGTKLEILSVDEDGWANVSTVDRGIEGWMAERLLTDKEI